MDQDNTPITPSSTPGAAALSDSIARGAVELPYLAPSPGEQARLDRERAPAPSPQSASEARRKEITQKLINEPHGPDAGKLKAELHQLLAGEFTPEEQAAAGEMDLRDFRSMFGVEHAFPTKTHEANWDTGHESNFLSHAAAKGWDGALVRDLMAGYLAATDGLGTPISDEALDRLENRMVRNGRISEADARLLRKWLRTEVEGGES